DAGCGVISAAYAASGAVGAGSTASLINFSGALASHAQGSLVFASGVNANLRATVKSVAVGASLSLMYPLPSPPATGDAFTVYAGCDHTQATCSSRFANLAAFRGFPFVPPPQIAY
ncbi:MAG: phage BR0599 family protein, partial [Roseiarcus sp.]